MENKTLQSQGVWGPESYVNWSMLERGEPLRAMFEVPLYSDARFVDELREGCGPYAFLNPIRHTSGATEPSIILRVKKYTVLDRLPNMEVTDTDSFTGGWLADEVACLCSLQVGARLMAGDISRVFYEPEADPVGEPRNEYIRPPPILFDPIRRVRLPRLLEEKRIGFNLFRIYPKIGPSDAVALVRSARAYRDAVWIAEAEPEIAWLLLVSALETAAVHYFKGEDEPEERLRTSAPELVQVLEARGGGELVREVAPLTAHLFKASTKFINFAMRFLPEPPEKRPPEGFCLKWSKTAMKELMKRVYNLRSVALHAGIPFPPPMCEPPTPEGPGWHAPSETFSGGASATLGGVWRSEDLPVTLHMFEYLVRGMLLGWWSHVAESSSKEKG
jgi:hypothetical protein